VTSRRARAAALALAWALLVTVPAGPASGQGQDPAAVVAQAACALPHEWLLRTWRGWRPDRGAEIQILPREPDFVGSGLPHVGPWDYVQRVPLLWYGPGHVPALGPVERPVTVAGIAPTQAALLGVPFPAVDGQPMREALLPSSERGEPPRLIVTLIWDAAGMNVLEAHPDAWPFLRSLAPKGVWFANATVGSSPTSTAQIHATIGTGSFPRNSGLVGHRLRIGGRITTPWSQGPAFIVRPTLADLYDRATGNRAKVGLLGTVSIHLGMLGHGAMWGGGDRDLAVLREAVGGDTLGAETFRWNLPASLRPYYRFPAYVNDVAGFEGFVQEVDQADGRLDGRWRDNDIDQLLAGFDTPARAPYQEKVLEEIIRREGFGADAVPDLLFVNHKIIDYISHVWTMNSPEMADAVRAEDRALRELVGSLDRQVGEGRWVLVLTADHGAIPDPARSGALQISAGAVAGAIQGRFDRDGDEAKIVELIQPTQIFVDEAELAENGATLADVAAFVMELTAEQVVPGVAPERAGERVFQAAFPSEIMDDLPCLPEARG
jgi:hypothetical protein